MIKHYTIKCCLLLVGLFAISYVQAQQVTLEAPSSNGESNYMWFQDNVAIMGATMSSYDPTETGVYYATYDVDGCGGATAYSIIECTNQTVTLDVGSNVTAGQTIMWSNGAMGTSIMVTPTTTATTYTAVLTDGAACTTTLPTFTVVGIPFPSIVSITPDCNATEAGIMLDATPNVVPAGLMFDWTGPNGFTSTDEDPVVPTGDPAYEGTYTVTVTNSFGCEVMGSIELTQANCAPLPVELLSFTAKAADCNINLRWSTASETNNSHFEIEHSYNAKDFRPIAKVVGAGTTLEVQNYAFTHQQAVSKSNYYRLKQVDLDGSYDYSDIITINNHCGQDKTQMSLYPNPVGDSDGRLQIEFYANTETSTRFSIWDIYGRKISEHQVETTADQWNTIALPVATLSAGAYFVMNEKGEIVRFVKQ